MAKKNVYKNLDLTSTKVELSRNIGYLSTEDIHTLNDDIEVVQTATGPRPSIIASIESKLDSYIVVVKDSILMLSSIISIENEVSDFVLNLIEKLETHLLDIEKYFEQRPPELIENREHFVTMYKKNRAGERIEYSVKIIAANIPTQIKNRSKIQKIILELKPVIASIKDAKLEEQLLKGDKAMPPAMLILMNE